MIALNFVLPPEISAELVLSCIVGVGIFIGIIIVYSGVVNRHAHADRLGAMRRHRVHLHLDAPHSGRRRHIGNDSASAGIFKIWLRYARSLRSNQMDALRKRLFRGGFRSREAMAVYVGGKLLSPVLLMILGFIIFFSYLPSAVPTAYRAAAMVAMVLIGFFGPDLVVFNTTSKRRAALQKSLPDGLDLLVICAEAGLSLDSALHRVAEEIAPSSPELSDELTVTSVELNFLPERRTALANLADRVALPAIRGVVNTLIQTERYGTPLSQSLRVLSAEFRDQRMLRAEEKAARLPAILTVPMILFILPTLFIVLVGPAMIDVFDHISR